MVRPRTDLTNHQLQRHARDSSGPDDLTLVSGVLEFTEHQVREVMTPRTEIVAVAEETPLEDICRVFVESGFSRLPTYRDSLDHIVGIYYALDILKLSPGGHLPIRPVTLVPTTRPCADLLFEMQRERRLVAVVLDEYGGTAGIATMNDLLADLVEETFDTAEAQDYPDVPLPAVIEVAGTAPVDDVADKFGVSLPGSSETIGGLLSTAAGRIPKAGERFELAGLEFDVVEATATRVERVTVRGARVPVIQLRPAGMQ